MLLLIHPHCPHPLSSRQPPHHGLSQLVHVDLAVTDRRIPDSPDREGASFDLEPITRYDRLNPPEIREQISERIPLRRFGTPEEVANLARFLCLEGEYITGQVMSINGGLYV